jgi:hypothetical protein
MKFVKSILILFFTLLVFFLFLDYKKTPDQKSFLYLKLRIIIIQNIEFVKNTNLFKEYLFFKGRNNLNEDFSNKIFFKNKKILKNEYILDKKQVNIVEISLDELIIQLKNNLFQAKKNNSDLVRLNQTVNFNLSKPDGNYKIYKAIYENINTFGILEKTNKNKLIIYNQGHLGNAYNKDYYLKTKRYFKDKGYDFFTLNTLGRGFNYQGNVNFPNTSNELGLNTYNHENIQFYFNKKNTIKKPLSLFLSGNYYLIKHLLSQNQYDEIIFFGVSGGGWYGLFLSALINDISDTFIFNGNVPLYLAIFDDTKLDWEQSKSKIYNKINYWALYKMIYRNPININKKLYLIYNKKDKCCFRDPSASVMKKFETKINNKRFLVRLYEREKFHGLDLDNFLKIIKQNN